jgi:hypothetical protein
LTSEANFLNFRLPLARKGNFALSAKSPRGALPASSRLSPDLRPIDLLREVYDDGTGGVAAVPLSEERLSILIREAVASALESAPSR